MILELERSDFKWLCALLNNFTLSEIVDCFSSDGHKKVETAYEIMATKKENSNLYLVDLDYDAWFFLYDLVSNNRCCCPECTKASVQHRRDIVKKLDYIKACEMW